MSEQKYLFPVGASDEALEVLKKGRRGKKKGEAHTEDSEKKVDPNPVIHGKIYRERMKMLDKIPYGFREDGKYTLVIDASFIYDQARKREGQ